jgi:NADP-dependent aldehyde dehydrogenase
MKLEGTSIIGYRKGTTGGETLQAYNPATGKPLEPLYYTARSQEVEIAVKLAGEAFRIYGKTPGCEKGKFLRAIAKNLENALDEIVVRAVRETGLVAARIQSETARTCAQLRMFASLVEDGSWVDARIDRGDPKRTPAPKPDIRSMMQPIGPVVVFCASNFPLAFSVAGGDTASALAAGNPVVVNAHYSHPGTAEIAGIAIRDAAKECGIPEGVFSLIYGAGFETGQSIVHHPLIKAVAFTGSRKGGLALAEIARTRPEPIPVYAEMSSINPVFILPGAMRERRDEIAKGLCGSVTLGTGQFCTNPGLVFLAEDGDAILFSAHLAELMKKAPSGVMLNSTIYSAYQRVTYERLHGVNVKKLAGDAISLDDGGYRVGATLFATDAQTFLANPDLSDEVFGPSTLFVTHSGKEELLALASMLEGQLTATVHATEQDLHNHAELIAILETKVGRIVFNGYPTGVEVCSAMVHGGPFPATSDGKFTSVGTRAIYRFARPVCYQDFPDFALPPELQEANPLGIPRMVDGKIRR